MKEQFVTYKMALKLKELGFDEECLGAFISENIFLFGKSRQVNYMKWDAPAILWQQAIEFLSEQYNILIYIDFTPKESYFYRETKLGYSLYHIDSEAENENKINFYEAREQAILKAIELIQSATKAGENE
jgi:hypothetical protein